MAQISPQELARHIDHTILKPDASAVQVLRICEEAMEHGFWSVCVNPVWVAEAATMLKCSPVKVCTVIGFPLGANHSRVKAYEAETAVNEGATEVDMVINVGALKSGRLEQVRSDIRAVVEAVRGGALVKVILETALLDEVEKITACQITVDAGAQYVKTSTGFGPSGATVGDIALMRRIVGPNFGVKASGGIRDLQTTLALIEAGADRIGASAGIKILSELSR